MPDKKVKVVLSAAVTFKGVDYQAGEQEMPEEAAKLAVKKKFGKLAGQEDEAEFTPLSLEETMERFGKGDSSDEVFKSLKFHQSAIVGGMKSDKSQADVIKETDKPKGDTKSVENKENPGGNAETTGNANAEDTGADGSTNTSQGLPEDFPMRHVFERLGFKTIEEVKAKTRQELIDLDGIGDATADKALAYGK